MMFGCASCFARVLFFSASLMDVRMYDKKKQMEGADLFLPSLLSQSQDPPGQPRCPPPRLFGVGQANVGHRERGRDRAASCQQGL